MKDVASRPIGKTIFLTGASGVVGQALLPALSDHTVVCLVHRTPVSGPNVISLAGDVTQPRLGLERAEFDDVARRIDCIVHAAAITAFSQPQQVIFRANVDGSAHVLHLAEAARVPLYYISTAFVHPCVYTADGEEPNAYVLSKREAESVVLGSGLPAAILRPSIVVGDSRSGAIAAFQGIHMMAALFLKGLLPLLPAPAHAYLDFVPQDVVAAAIAALIDRGHAGGEWWLTAGERALSPRELVDICVGHAQRLAGPAVVPPRIVSPDVFERLIRPVFLPALPGHLRRAIMPVLELSRHCSEQPLPSSLPDLERQLRLPPLPDQGLTVTRNLDY